MKPKMSNTEFKVSTIRAYDKNCKGCRRHNSHLMISFQKKKGGEVYDLFLNKDQTEIFRKELDLKMNKGI